MSSLVSLIMPAWNPRPDWLHMAVTSALASGGDDLELIVVDDASGAPVADLLLDLDDERLRVVRIGHAGPYGARNAGLEHARGDFVRFVDSDDVVEPDSTGALLAAAVEDSGVIAYGATLVCDEHLAPVRLEECTLEGHVAEACLLGRFSVFHVSMIFPRAVVEDAGGWPRRPFPVSGDWDFVLRAVERAPVRRLDLLATRYRRHGGSVMSSADIGTGGIARRMIIEGYLERHPEARGSGIERQAYASMHLDQLAAHAWRGERRHAAGELRRAVRLAPGDAATTVIRLARARWHMARSGDTTPEPPAGPTPE
jgi:glycosyltransferase involved in cell wall biosynthesis